MSNSKADLKPPPLFALPDLGELSLPDLVKQTARRFNKHDIATKAAAISFYSIIAMVPLMAVVLTVFTHLMPPVEELLAIRQGNQPAAVLHVKRQIRRFVPSSAYQVIDDQIARMRTNNPVTLVSISIVIATWTASSVFATICKTMTDVYEYQDSRNFVRLRLIAFLITLAHGFVFLLCMLAFFLWPLVSYFITLSSAGMLLATFIEWSIIIFVVLSSFSVLLHIGPAGPRCHPIITPGTLFAAPVFLISTWLFRLYIQNAPSYNQMYGSLGGVMILMLWFWIAGLVLLTGAAMDGAIAASRWQIDQQE